MLAGFLGVVDRVKMVTMRNMRVVAGFLVARGAVMFRRVAMMLGGGFVVLGGLIVMFGQHAFVHDPLTPPPRAACPRRDRTPGR
jgi:hypothetical protein